MLMKYNRVVFTALLCFTHAAFAQGESEKGVLFTMVVVWDRTSEALRNADVLVTGNKISKVSDEPMAVIRLTNMHIVDGGGRTLMPGLIESHVHMNLKHMIGGNEALSGALDRPAREKAAMDLIMTDGVLDKSTL
jgi:imidazolonepropionase-like amidohydrolase